MAQPGGGCACARDPVLAGCVRVRTPNARRPEANREQKAYLCEGTSGSRCYIWVQWVSHDLLGGPARARWRARQEDTCAELSRAESMQRRDGRTVVHPNAVWDGRRLARADGSAYMHVTQSVAAVRSNLYTRDMGLERSVQCPEEPIVRIYAVPECMLDEWPKIDQRR